MPPILMVMPFGTTLCFFLYAVPRNLFKRYSGNSMSKKCPLKLLLNAVKFDLLLLIIGVKLMSKNSMGDNET